MMEEATLNSHTLTHEMVQNLSPDKFRQLEEFIKAAEMRNTAKPEGGGIQNAKNKMNVIIDNQ